jgi:hypothetical protein
VSRIWNDPQLEGSGQTMPLDEMTRRNLELVESLRAEADQLNGRDGRNDQARFWASSIGRKRQWALDCFASGSWLHC